jgi:hypothetical protein
MDNPRYNSLGGGGDIRSLYVSFLKKIVFHENFHTQVGFMDNPWYNSLGGASNLSDLLCMERYKEEPIWYNFWKK